MAPHATAPGQRRPERRPRHIKHPAKAQFFTPHQHNVRRYHKAKRYQPAPCKQEARDPESTSARLARPSCAPRLHVARDHACAASPPAPCSSAACCPRPHLRGLPACVVFLGSMAFETHLRGLPACVVLLDPMTRDTLVRPARLRRAPRLHVARDHACAACPPAPCSSIARCSRPQPLRGQPACVVFLSPISRDTPARPARLRRAPRLLGCMPPRDHPRPARLRRAPQLIGSMLPETASARPTHLKTKAVHQTPLVRQPTHSSFRGANMIRVKMAT
ncbi:hypothetical protein C4D60_Mb04t32220 [Musa balbisiana]|uniref:Uncharacterized protein n=1 Tax=Musa balbisiana TaxID=52838 RepID=A0A4S8KG77_MUSBA|nr:hypothetical protein C4D60_Mb04t32220 [Musa balbisiana]